MKLKLYKSKPELKSIIYFGLEYGKRNGYYTGRWFYFINIPSHDPEVKPGSLRQNVDDFEIEHRVWEKIKEDLKKYLGEEKYPSFGFELLKLERDFIEIKVSDFNPEGFCEDRYQKIINLLDDTELKEKLEKLKEKADPCSEASASINPK